MSEGRDRDAFQVGGRKAQFVEDWRTVWVLAKAAEQATPELKERLKLNRIIRLGYDMAERMRAEVDTPNNES